VTACSRTVDILREDRDLAQQRLRLGQASAIALEERPLALDETARLFAFALPRSAAACCRNLP